MTHYYNTAYHRVLAAILLLAGLCLPLTAAESATAILDKAAAQARSAKSLKATYTITADGHSQSGTLTIAGDRFIISSPQVSSWYDGKTQWTYSTQTGEVNITEPTPEEAPAGSDHLRNHQLIPQALQGNAPPKRPQETTKSV